MQKRLCGKVIHLTAESAQIHSDSLGERNGQNPNVYPCDICSTDNNIVWHVGYGYDDSKLSKRARRQRKQARRRKKKGNGS